MEFELDFLTLLLNNNIVPKNRAAKSKVKKSKVTFHRKNTFKYLLSGIFAIFLLILIVSVLKSTQMQSPQNTTVQPNTLISDWKTYRNETYGFELTYPANGIDYEGNAIECGNAIEAASPGYIPNGLVAYINIDNFFGISGEDWDKSLQEYVQEHSQLQEDWKGMSINDLYEITPISDSNADDAVQIKYARGGFEKGAGADNAPFGHTIALFTKNGKLFTILDYQDHASMKGCTVPKKPSNWDIPNSIKFL